MTYADGRFGETVNGYKLIKEASPLKSYFASLWTIDNSAEWTEQQRAEWERKKQLRQQQQAKEEEFKKGRSLSAEERDRNYRIVFDQLTLHPDDKADLLWRGLSEEEINELIATGFRSVRQGQNYLSDRINPLLPGASGGDGKHIYSPVDGYVNPVPDINGLICGLQVRARDAQKGNRYRWVNTKHQTLHLFPDSSKELPLAVYKPQGKALGVVLVEGTGVKPFLASRRLNHSVIGAAGGQWVSSPVLLKESLAVLAEGEEVKLSPDAGDVLNPVVMNRWRKVVELVSELGYKPVILWWGQVTKADSDIDELTDLSIIKSISPDEFFKIAKKAQAEATKEEESQQEKLKAEAENALYTELTGITEKPWLELNTPKLELKQYIEKGAVYIILSGMGTNKTNSMKPVLAEFDAGFADFNRKALGNEECKRLGITWVGEGFSTAKKKGFCTNSSYKHSPSEISKNGFLLVDESDQVFDHNFGETCNRDGVRPLILNHLEAHIEAAVLGGGAAFFMSADITQKEIDYIKELTPVGVPVRFIVNHYKPQKGNLYFDESDNPDGQIEMLLSQLEDGIPCFVVDDIKNGIKGCKSIAELIRTVHPEWADLIVEINSDTSGSPEIIAFLENINEASKDKLLICCSPSVISGISIENGRFNQGVFGFFNGILTVSQASQALGRVRGAESTYVWAAEEGLVWEGNKATHPREISEYYQRNYAANSKHLQSFKPDYEVINNEWSSPHWRLYCKNAAYRNLCMSKLRERLKKHLIDQCFKLHSIASAESDMVKNGLKEAWSKIELSEAEAVDKAEFFSDDELEELMFNSQELTPEQKPRFEKTMLRRRFGDPLIQATTFEHKETGKSLTGYAAMYLKNERGEHYRKLENYYLLMSDESEAIERDLAREYRQLKHGCGRFAADVRWQGRKRKCREWLGLREFLEPDKWHTPADYQQLVNRAKSKASMIKDCLGINVENIPTNAQIVTELAAQVGIEFDKRRVDGQKWKERKVNAESLKFAQMFVEHKLALKAEAEAKQAAYEAAKEYSFTNQVQEVVEAPIVEVVEVEPVQLGVFDQPVVEAPVTPVTSVTTVEEAIGKVRAEAKPVESESVLNFGEMVRKTAANINVGSLVNYVHSSALWRVVTKGSTCYFIQKDGEKREKMVEPWEIALA
jgi:hypothetical protein